MLELALQPGMTSEGSQRISAAFARQRRRLVGWLRQRVSDPDVEDILQDAFSELVQAYSLSTSLATPIEDEGAWLFRVVRNRVIDLFRKRRPESLEEQAGKNEEGESLSLDELLPSADSGGPEGAYAREVMMELVEEAVDALPRDQREVFLMHEIEGLSFQQISALSGVRVGTLISRKHLAVKSLRRRLRGVYEELNES